MKKIFFILLLSPFFVLAQVKTKGFIISGKVTGVADGADVKLYRNGESQELTKTKVQKGMFQLTGSVDEPVLCLLVIAANNPVQIYVENSKITLTPNAGQTFVITGSASHKDFKQFSDDFTPLVQQLSSLANAINSMGPGAERDGLMTTYNSMQQNIQKHIDNYISAKPHSVVSSFVLLATNQFNDDPFLLEKRFNMLDATVKNSGVGKQVADMIATAKVGAIGTEAMDFTQPDTTGAMVKLSSFRGKYVLVDFWASWCGPCRNENPNVVQNFQRFKNKNFTILSVSLDRPGQKDNWLQAIRHDNLAWTQVSDLKFWDNEAAKLYHIQSIPQNMLIDPSGKIVAKNLRGADLQNKLCEIFGCN